MLSLLLLLQALWNPTCERLRCTFDASASTGAIKSYSWAFGDSTAKSSGKLVTHTFARVGTYSVVLVVTDSTGHRSQLTKKITVGAVIARVDTVRLTRVDTVRVASKPDTVRLAAVHDTVFRLVPDTAWLFKPVRLDTLAFSFTLPSQWNGGRMVDSSGARPWRVYNVRLMGVIDPVSSGYRLWKPTDTVFGDTLQSTIMAGGWLFPTLAEALKNIQPILP